ncbi:MAG: DUF3662 and FHA domain-containing protein [Actinomycetes bacterium]
MGLLNNLEARLDKFVNGSFSKAFKSAVEPVELAAALQQELDLRAENIGAQTVTPNIFIFSLSPADHDRFAQYFTTLRSELATVASTYATQQRYDTVDRPVVSFSQDDELETGVFKITSTSGPAGSTMTDAVNLDLTPQVPINAIMNDSTPKLVTIAGAEFALTQSVTTIGRGDTAQVRIDDPGISRAHFQIVLGSQVVIKDLGSTNGTLVDGHRITEATLHDGSIIKIGATTLTYKSR